MKLWLGIIMAFSLQFGNAQQTELKWNGLDLSKQSWIHLQRDEKGYLIYKPCQEEIGQIEILEKEIIFQWINDDPDYFDIGELITDESNNTFTVSFSGSFGKKGKAVVKAIDKTRGLYYWKIMFDNASDKPASEIKWVTTLKNHKKNFRFVTQSCSDKTQKEKTFLPVEFN